MCRFAHILIVVSLFLVSAASFGQAPSVDDGPYKIHVITIGQGEELFTRFGHIAMMVENTANNEKYVYNFGTFDFEDPELRFKYARGFLNYWLSVVNFDVFYRWYGEMNRDMWIQTLNLSDAQAAEMAHKLAVNARPENRYYAYRHYLDNCCTRIRDVIDNATDRAISKKFKKQPVDRDFRYWTAEALKGLPLYKSVILYSLGPAIDQPLTRWDEEFLPEVLFKDLDKVTLGKSGVPLVASKRQLLTRQGPPIGKSIPSVDIIVMVVIGLLIIVGFGIPLMVGNKKWSRRCLGLGLTFWGLLAGLGGLMLVLYWTITTHYDTHYNENLLVNPILHLWMIGPGVMLLLRARIRPRTFKILQWYLLGSFALIVIDILLKIGPFIQNNWGTIALAVALNTAAYFALTRTREKV